MISEDDLEAGEEELQKVTDKMVQHVDLIGEKKEKEIMEV
jgi:ribosome recycling factor